VREQLIRGIEELMNLHAKGTRVCSRFNRYEAGTYLGRVPNLLGTGELLYQAMWDTGQMGTFADGVLLVIDDELSPERRNV
jgi:hypothetical protein